MTEIRRVTSALAVYGRCCPHLNQVHELLVGLGRELGAGIRRALALVVVPRAGRADTEALPRIAERQEHRIALEGAGPAGAAALDRVGDVSVPALADEIAEPAVAAVGLGLVGHAAQPALGPHPPRQLALRGCRWDI